MLADRFPRSSVIGRALRWPLRLVPTREPRKIVSGAGAGLIWYPASGPHGIWLGVYERRVLQTLERELRDRFVVWDVGAHAGLYSLVAARKGATVVAFEPLDANVQWIAKHLEANALSHKVSIQPYALGAHSGTARFEPEVTRMTGTLSATGRTIVRIFAADDLKVPLPDVMKIDVEGAELDVLKGAARVIRSKRPLIFLEVHPPVAIADCLELLPGYRAEQIDGNRFLCRPESMEA